MRQLISSLAVISQVLICALLLVACESDQDFDTDNQSTNIKLENAEQIALGVIHSSLLSQVDTALFDFLTLEISNDEVVEDTKGLGYLVSKTCDGGGKMDYQTSRHPIKGDGFPARYQKGDALTVTYDECDDALGSVFNGEVEARYTSIKGLNNTFLEVDSPHCVANLMDDWEDISNNDHSDIIADADAIISSLTETDALLDNKNTFESFSYKKYEVVIVLGDELVFKKDANGTYAESAFFTDTDLEPDDEFSGLEREKDVWTYSIDPDDDYIFVNLQLGRSDDGQVLLNGDKRVGEDENGLVYLSKGNRVWSFVDGEDEVINCQRYKRSLIADVKNLSTTKGELKTTLDGLLDISQSSTNFKRLDNSILDSSFDIKVKQNNANASYRMRSFTVLNMIDSETGVYKLDVSGRIKSDDLFGTVELTGSFVTGHMAEEHPDAGFVMILGKGLEQILVTIQAFQIGLDIDFNGDTTGDAAPDFDAGILTTWDALLERDFKEAE